MLTLLIAAGIAITVTAMHVQNANARPVEARASEATIASADASAETIASSQDHASPTRTEWHLTTVSDLCDAEDLLDTLENQGVEERELVVLGNSCFVVRWR